MGPGKDLDILRETFNSSGSDNSKVFIDLYKEKNPEIDVFLLDAITMDTEKKFDCIYSNKVLHHLSREDIKKSFQNQYRVLNDNGYLFHTFWYGDKEEEHHGLYFLYLTEDHLKEIIGEKYDIVEMTRYDEMEKNDSIYIVLKKR